MAETLIDKKELAENLDAWIGRYRTGTYEVPAPTLYKDCRDMLATINDLMERLEEVLAEQLAEPAEKDGLAALTMTPEAGLLFWKALIYAANRIPTEARVEGAEDSHENWLRWGASRLDAALLAAADGEPEVAR